MSSKELKKQALDQSLHLLLGLACVSGLAAPSDPVGFWVGVSATAAWVVALIVHIIQRIVKKKNIMENPADWAYVAVLFVLPAANPFFFGFDQWRDAVLLGLFLAAGREVLQKPVKRVWDAALDMTVIVIGSTAGFFIFRAIAQAVS